MAERTDAARLRSAVRRMWRCSARRISIFAPFQQDEQLEILSKKTFEIVTALHIARLKKDGVDGGDLIRSQKSLICDDITGLPETDEVGKVLFMIQDLLVPFLPDEYPDENA